MFAIKPIFLLADSQLLFWRSGDASLMARVRSALDEEPSETTAAYIGAANGDEPAYYDIFVAAMDGIGIHDCRMIPSAPSAEDNAHLDAADIILLAGGDIARGWDVFQKQGFVDRIIAAYAAGAILIGVSAGAVQLGLKGWRGHAPTASDLFDTFRLVPYLIDVHQGPAWDRLRQLVHLTGKGTRALGIPAGGGAIFHRDWTLEPVRYSLIEFTFGEDEITQSLLAPPNETPPGSRI